MIPQKIRGAFGGIWCIDGQKIPFLKPGFSSIGLLVWSLENVGSNIFPKNDLPTMKNRVSLLKFLIIDKHQMLSRIKSVES